MRLAGLERLSRIIWGRYTREFSGEIRIFNDLLVMWVQLACQFVRTSISFYLRFKHVSVF